LAETAAPYLKERNAVLLGHHGLLCVGGDVPGAFRVAEETEFVAEIYYKMKALGRTDTLSDADMRAAMERFKTYG
jgi:L-fuculose-phosphate aldolase